MWWSYLNSSGYDGLCYRYVPFRTTCLKRNIDCINTQLTYLKTLMNWAVYNITWILILNVAFSPFSWWYLMVDTLGTTTGLTKGSLQT